MGLVLLEITRGDLTALVKKMYGLHSPSTWSSHKDPCSCTKKWLETICLDDEFVHNDELFTVKCVCIAHESALMSVEGSICDLHDHPFWSRRLLEYKPDDWVSFVRRNPDKMYKAVSAAIGSDLNFENGQLNKLVQIGWDPNKLYPYLGAEDVHPLVAASIMCNSTFISCALDENSIYPEDEELSIYDHILINCSISVTDGMSLDKAVDILNHLESIKVPFWSSVDPLHYIHTSLLQADIILEGIISRLWQLDMGDVAPLIMRLPEAKLNGNHTLGIFRETIMTDKIVPGFLIDVDGELSRVISVVHGTVRVGPRLIHIKDGFVGIKYSHHESVMTKSVS